MHIQVPIKDLLPNPHRRIKYYPFRPEKIEALKESIETTTFWDNLVGRQRNGKVEIAYGHHRLEALRQLYKPSHEIGINVRDFSESDMLQIMARENMEEWGTSAIVEFETVRAVVEAYANGEIELSQPDRRTKKELIRYAPSFLAGDDHALVRDRPYTAATVAKFLGWQEPDGDASRKIRTALSGLQLIQEELVTEEAFAGMKTMEAAAIVEKTLQQKVQSERVAKELERKAKETPNERQAESFRRQATTERKTGRERATKVGKAISSAFRKGTHGYRQADQVADSVIPLKTRPLRQIQEVFRKLTREISGLFDGDERDEKLRELLEFSQEISSDQRQYFVHELDRLINRIETIKQSWLNTFDIKKPVNANKLLK